MIICKICGEEIKEAGQHEILNKYRIKYFYCDHCGFMQTEEPYWLNEAYANPINKTDTGYVTRNIFLSKKTLLLFLFLFGKRAVFLDYAGGYGLLTRLMRDYGLDFYWYDLYTKNIFAPGFEFNETNNTKITAVTCFECFEHFVSPLYEIEKILKISKNVFFSTRLIPENEAPKKSWEYYGFDHGQHISFYSKKTLQYVANKYHLNYYTNGNNLHLFTEKRRVGFLFKLALISSKLQLDILVRKLLKSKMISDAVKLKV